MSDVPNETEIKLPQLVELAENKDWFLQSTIDTVIYLGVEFGVTLTVKGMIVSGTLVSGKVYFEELAKTMAKSSKAPDDVSQVLAESWAKYSEIYVKPDGASEDWTPGPATYIHMKNARFFMPGQSPIPANNGVLWRGRLSSIDGFCIGSFSVD